MKIIIYGVLVAMILAGMAACRFFAPEVPASLPVTATATGEVLAEDTATATATQSATAEPTTTTTPTPTGTPEPTPTDTPTVIPTYVYLRGEVMVEHANCRYGPGADYLYKYGLVGGSNLEIIGRNELGTWIEIRAIGGSNPCWVKASLMEIRGDVMSVWPVDPEDVKLPASPYYGPPRGVSARRDGEVVTVSWSPVGMRAGDDSGQVTYLVEAWVCLDGRLVFTPTGTYRTALAITDQAGCAEASHGRLYFVEKHGYTLPVEIPWPGANP